MRIKNLLAIAIIVLFSSNMSGQDEAQTRLCPCDDGIQKPMYQECAYMEDCVEAQACAMRKMLISIYRVMKYPVEARRNSIQGTIVLEFEVGVDGIARNFRVQSDALGYGIPEAAIEGARVLNDRRFYPAEEDCIPVEYTYVLPVTFKLQ